MPQTRYVQTSDGIHIAYQVIGDGERDMVLVPGLMSHLELIWEDHETADFYRRLARLGRLIMFDKRDTGLSDRAPGDMSLEERMEDVRAVMQAAGSSRAVLFGYSEGAPMSILFAATYPERVTALILASASARWFPAPGYPCGQGAQEMYDALRDIAAHRWGQGESIEWYLPSRAHSARSRQLLGRFERMAVNPSAFLRLTQMIHDIDVRAVLPAIHVPTLVIQRLGDRITPPCHGRYLASHIAGARYFEQPGDHCAAVRRERGQRRAVRGDRRLPRQPPRSPAIRTGCWPRSCAPRAGRAADGEPRQGSGPRSPGPPDQDGADGLLATFDAPGQAIRCAAAVLADGAAAGIQIRAGIHTGEVDLVGEDIAGASVRITDRVAALARPAEILVSRTVKDLVTGSGITFAERGSHVLDGPSEEWPLFAVTGWHRLTRPGGCPAAEPGWRAAGGQAALEVGPDLGDPAVLVLERAGGLDDDVGHGQPLLAAGLSREPGLGLLGRHPARR